VIVLDGEQRIELSSRVAAMVRWLAEQTERVSVPDKIAVTFDCAGSKVSAEVREREPVDTAFLR